MPLRNRKRPNGPARVTLLLALAGLLLGPSTALAGPLFAFTDHTGEDHSGEDHRNQNLESIILANATLVSTDFRNTILRNAVLTSADLTDASLRNADLSNADFTGATMVDVNGRNANFSGAILDGVDFSTGEIRNANFAGASLLGADLSDLSNADRADFTGAFYDALTRLAPGMDTSTMTLVPEPSSAMLLLLGLIGLEACGRPRRRQRS